MSTAAPESETAGTVTTGAARPFQSDARSSASYGLLSGPSVNLAGEIIEQLTASTTFMAVAQVIRADFEDDRGAARHQGLTRVRTIVSV